MLAVVASVAAHAAVFAWGEFSFFGTIEVPEIEFDFTEVELVDPDMLQGDEPVEPTPPTLVYGPPEVERPPPPEPEDPGDQQPPDEPESDKRRLGEKKSKVDQLGPTNSTFYALLVPRRMRKLPFAENAMDIMAPLPDFEFLVRDGGFDALRDFDHLVIASPDIRDVTQTFLAVDYKMPREQVVRAIEIAAAKNHQSIDWTESEGALRGNPKPLDTTEPDLDPRYFVLPSDGVALYVRREFLPHVLGGEVGTEKTAGNYVANLAKLRRFAARQPTAGLQLVIKDIRAALKRARGLPFEAPDSIEVTAEAASDPELLIRVGFLSVVDAKAAEAFWRDDLARIVDGNLTLKLSAKWIYELLELERDGQEIRLWGRFSTAQAELVLKLLADFSAKVLRKDPADIAKARAERLQNWKDRQAGKLPPGSAHDAHAPANDPPTSAERVQSAAGSPPRAPPTAPKDDPQPAPPH